MSVLSGQTTVETDLTRVVPSIYGDRALYPVSLGVGGLAKLERSASPSEVAAGRQDECIFWCEQNIVAANVMWHRAYEDPWPPDFPWPPMFRYSLGHGLHYYWMQGHCFPYHLTCWLLPGETHEISLSEFTRRVSGAVAARDVSALAAYASLPSVSLFAKRSAIQLSGCDGKTVVAHIPVDPELLAAIEAATAQLASGG